MLPFVIQSLGALKGAIFKVKIIVHLRAMFCKMNNLGDLTGTDSVKEGILGRLGVLFHKLKSWSPSVAGEAIWRLKM